MSTPTFETDRLILRELRIQDAHSYQKYFNDYEVLKFLSANVPWPYPEDGARFYIENMVIPHQGKNRWDWGIFLKENPEELIGSIGLFHPGIPENRGFWLARKYWGMGIMTEAVKPVMDFAFDVLNLDEMIFANAVQNKASHRVKEKTGATLLEIRPGKYVDKSITKQEIWKLTKAEWQRISSN